MIILPPGTDFAAFYPWLIVCGVVFVAAFVGALIVEQFSEVAAGLLAIPAIAAVIAAFVLGIVMFSIHAADWAHTKQALQQGAKQNYGITLTEDQVNDLANGEIATLNDGSQVKLKFSDNKHRATLVHVNYTPVEGNR
jgi:phosphate/sulfate permease